MTKHLVHLLIIALGGCGASTSKSPIAEKAPPASESVVAVGDQWDDAVAKFSGAGAKPDVRLMLGWMSEEEHADIYHAVPKLPGRQVWVLSDGTAVKLWGDGIAAFEAPRRVTRIEQVSTEVKWGVTSVTGKPRDVELVRLERRPDAR